MPYGSYLSEQERIARKKARNKAWAEANGRDKHLRQKYNITIFEYDEMLRLQGGVCALCGTDDPTTTRTKFFCVDHNKRTGKIRGLLCDKCNRKLGYFNDDPELLRKAIAYLERSQ